MQHFLAQKALILMHCAWKMLWYVIAPPLCSACRGYMQQRATLCSSCEQSIELIAPKLFSINSSYVLTVYTVSRYTQPLRPMLFAKYRSDDVVLEKLADIIWHKSVVSMVHVDFFIPIPLHWTRNLKRGFNQAELIAQRLSHHSKIPVLPCIVRRSKTNYQTRIDHADRVVNVKNSMSATQQAQLIAGKHVMLVDDSCTTGATALEAARALIAYKPASINLIVACRAL